MKVLRTGLVTLVAAAVLYAGEPWDDKKPSEWNEKEVVRILQNSPWGKRVVTRTGMEKEADKSGSTARGSTSGGGSTSTIADRGALRPLDHATVTWWSARTPRRAYLRYAQLRGAQISEEDARQFTETEMPEHIIVIESSGEMVELNAKLEEAQLKQAVWLDLGRNQRVEPVSAGVVMEGDKATRLRFHFPREWNGEPLSAQRRIIFKFRLPNVKGERLDNATVNEAAFEPRKMTIGSEADN